jgi:hypothetical protein
MWRAAFALSAVALIVTQASADMAPGTGKPSELWIRIKWTHAGEKPRTENNGVYPFFVLAPNHLIVSSTTLTMMEASSNVQPASVEYRQ